MLLKDDSELPSEIHVGDPVTRTIRLQAQGLGFEQLPELNLTAPDGAEIYPDKADTRTRDDGTWLYGERVRKFAFVPTRPGTLTIPGVSVHWWDTAHDRMETAELPAHTLTVLPAAGGKGTAAPPAAASSQPDAQPGERQRAGRSLRRRKRPRRRPTSLRTWQALAGARIPAVADHARSLVAIAPRGADRRRQRHRRTRQPAHRRNARRSCARAHSASSRAPSVRWSRGRAASARTCAISASSPDDSRTLRNATRSPRCSARDTPVPRRTASARSSSERSRRVWRGPMPAAAGARQIAIARAVSGVASRRSIDDHLVACGDAIAERGKTMRPLRRKSRRERARLDGATRCGARRDVRCDVGLARSGLPWEIWESPARLATLDAGDIVLERSSHCLDGCRYDRSNPGPEDPADNPYPLRWLYRDGDEAVLFDERGPGAITRFWLTTGFGASTCIDPAIRVRFYLDGAATPALDVPLAALFDGSTLPFTPPLVADRHSRPAVATSATCRSRTRIRCASRSSMRTTAARIPARATTSVCCGFKSSTIALRRAPR